MALKDERSPKYAFPEAGTSLLKSPTVALTATDAAGTLEKNLLELLLCPCRTGKRHGPEGRTESKICVSRGRNVPSEIS